MKNMPLASLYTPGRSRHWYNIVPATTILSSVFGTNRYYYCGTSTNIFDFFVSGAPYILLSGKFQKYLFRTACVCVRVSQTLTARATRLESSASRVRVAAEKERYRRTSAAKRRRASGPNNMSQFMRETIRNRKSQGKVRVTVTQQDRLETVAAHPSDDGDLFQKCSNNNSTSSRLIASFVVPPRANKVYSDDGRSRYCSTPVLTKRDRPNNLNRAWSAGVVGRGSPHSCTSSPEGPSKVCHSCKL